MEIIGFNDIKRLNIPHETFYDWAYDLMKNKKETVLPPKISMKMPGHIFFNVMPSIIPSIDSAGVKMVTRFPDRNPALDGDILLYNSNDGRISAIMDGLYITTMRTGAIASLAIETLAKKGYNEIGIIGLGNTARATLLVLLSRIGNKNLKIKLFNYKDQAEKFIDRFKEFKNINFVVVDTYEEVITNSDVILSCVTFANENFGKDEWFKEGCLVVPVHTMGFQNCDLFFDKVIVDDIGHVEGFKYFKEFKKCAELSEVLNNEKEGRINEKERILAYNIGLSIEDVYFAKKINNMIKAEKIDNYTKPIDKFWV